MPIKDTAREFFEAYDDQDVERMASLATEDAEVRYVPLGEDGRGSVHEVGTATWSALIDAFPDFHNEVEWITEDENGDAFIRVFIGGTQEQELWGIPSRGEECWIDHLFILRGNDDDEITAIVAYWDNVTFLEQVGAM
ncbi:nuclear transport factor 2 family protein [Natronococcus sp. A-GB7]|uniref:nuclear transport factor 2 family protein n=1 Tax=Natronococcus sp. A-GB7 TaxID=3037649 RepID=UPI00241D1596|nr:nuclear transport factor 2 family protein [Natronococcus sp. A-GB7]MDG5817578.1 nuclear transport factor 2 family protein [Natronococcus sp. A-GB7]